MNATLINFTESYINQMNDPACNILAGYNLGMNLTYTNLFLLVIFITVAKYLAKLVQWGLKKVYYKIRGVMNER